MGLTRIFARVVYLLNHITWGFLTGGQTPGRACHFVVCNVRRAERAYEDVYLQ